MWDIMMRKSAGKLRLTYVRCTLPINYIIKLTANMKRSSAGQKKKLRAYTPNNFLLIPIYQTCHHKLIKINFTHQKIKSQVSEPKTENSSKEKNEKLYSIIPTFNNDGKYFTHSFFLPIDEIDNQYPDKELIEAYEMKVNESVAEFKAEDMLVPKPKRKNNYCAVCRQQYEDYLDHIQQDSHKNKIRRSLYNGYINQLAYQINLQNKSHQVITRQTTKKMEEIQMKISKTNTKPKPKTKAGKKKQWAVQSLQKDTKGFQQTMGKSTTIYSIEH